MAKRVILIVSGVLLVVIIAGGFVYKWLIKDSDEEDELEELEEME